MWVLPAHDHTVGTVPGVKSRHPRPESLLYHERVRRICAQQSGNECRRRKEDEKCK